MAQHLAQVKDPHSGALTDARGTGDRCEQLWNIQNPARDGADYANFQTVSVHSTLLHESNNYLYDVAYLQRDVALLLVAFNVTQSNIVATEANKQFPRGISESSPPSPSHGYPSHLAEGQIIDLAFCFCGSEKYPRDIR